MTLNTILIKIASLYDSHKMVSSFQLRLQLFGIFGDQWQVYAIFNHFL